MKPLKIFIFFIAVFGLLFLLAMVFPEGGISIGKDANLRFASLSSYLNDDPVIPNYTDSLIQTSELADDPEELEVEVDTILVTGDSLVVLLNDSIIEARIDSISENVYPILLDNVSRQGLYSFFRKAERSTREEKIVRVLHYGDSQIENDRMSSLMRYRLQKVFGGSGCGMVPAIPLYFGNPAYKQDIEGDWIRYTGFGNRDSTIGHNCYGAMICFTSIPLPGEELPFVEYRFIKGRRAARFQKMNVYLHAFRDSNLLYVNANDTIIDTLAITSSGFRELEYLSEVPVERLKLSFDFSEGGRIYGISFDAKSGVQLDNMALRGSSGTEFSRSDRRLLDTMVRSMNTSLILMQFGGNVVPYIKNAAFYKKIFKRELNYLKQLFPDIPIIVIGPSDMSTKENGKFVTYQNLVPVRDALYEAALETHCGFWDMFEAMGGENSIQHFVLSEPPLANTDYIHFTPRGANLMAGLFFDALMLEYGKYKTSSN